MLNLSDYPKTLKLNDGREVAARILEPRDEDELRRFLKALPPAERIRFRDDVTDPNVIRAWTHNIDLNNVIPLIATHDGQIVANWTLHHRLHGWTRHHANIRGIVKPDWRGHGLATLMVYELLSIAGQIEIENVVLQLIHDQKREIGKYRKIGFEVEAKLKKWVKDLKGQYHDMYILSMKLEPAWRKMEEMILDYGTHGG